VNTSPSRRPAPLVLRHATEPEPCRRFRVDRAITDYYGPFHVGTVVRRLASGPIEDALEVGINGLVGRHSKFVSVRPDGDNFRVVATRETRSANHDQRCEDCQSRRAVVFVDIGHSNLHPAKKHDDQRTCEYAQSEKNRLVYPELVQTRPNVLRKR
jgi:hypothetical protein